MFELLFYERGLNSGCFGCNIGNEREKYKMDEAIKGRQAYSDILGAGLFVC